MVYLKKEKGITMIALVIMVIVIMILAGVTINQGIDLVKETKVETLVTNMITIRAKSKIYAEEVNAELWDATDKENKRAELFSKKYKMNKIVDNTNIVAKLGSDFNQSNGVECYEITKETLKQMNLNDLADETKDSDYVVVYDASDYKNIEIIYTPGKEYQGNTYYTLTTLQGKIKE